MTTTTATPAAVLAVFSVAAPGRADHIFAMPAGRGLDINSVRKHLVASGRFPNGFIIEVPTVGAWIVGEGEERPNDAFEQARYVILSPMVARECAVWISQAAGTPDRLLTTDVDVTVDDLRGLETRDGEERVITRVCKAGCWPVKQVDFTLSMDSRGMDQDGYMTSPPRTSHAM